MSGDCDICGEWGHVEYSCPHVEEALKLTQQARREAKSELERISKELSDAERSIEYYQEILRERRQLTKRVVDASPREAKSDKLSGSRN